MSELELLGRAANRKMPEAPPARERNDLKTLKGKRRYTLREASFLSDIAIHVLKQDIRDGKLAAVWEGRYLIEKPDLEAYMRS